MITAEAVLERFNDDVDAVIQQQLTTIHPFMANMASYFWGWVDQSFRPVVGKKGKKLRPTLNLLVHEALTGEFRPALPLAAGLELFHNYSLIHDDIEDRDEERRGRPTVWKVWGDGLALNCGSALHALAFQAWLALADVSADKMVALCGMLAETSMLVCEGQHMDMSFEKMIDVAPHLYLAMIERKTAALIQCATHTAAFLATSDPTVIEAYQQFGWHLGMAFQIRDDYLNIWRDSKTVGKPQYSDLRKKKKTLPVVYTLGALSAKPQTKLTAIYQRTQEAMSDEEIAFVIDCFTQVKAQEYIVEMTNRYTAEALTWLDKTNIDNEAQTQLRTLSSFLTGRNF